MWVPLVAASIFGLALLLGGMKMTETALRVWAGDRLNAALERTTSTPLRGFVSGTVTSGLLQSGTAVTLLTIGLVNAGMLPLANSFGILLGTNVGTTLTTELIGLRIHRFGLPLLGASLVVWLWTFLSLEARLAPPLPRHAAEALRYGSAATAGFALMLVGFASLQSIGPALQQNGTFAEWMAFAEQRPVWGLLGGAALSALVHSSSAVIGMAMSLADTGTLPAVTGVAVVLGANVGTCFTGLLASLAGGRGGRFVALSQIALNVGGTMLFYPLKGELLAVSAAIAPGHPAAQIAHAQTLFNVACSVLALPIAYLGVRALEPPQSPLARGK
ncbi:MULTISPECIES: Na/Pi cotransporter family protein [Cohnella]|uniref:Na/Pi cotransporter family protein n=1 Tax=Cohnella TaxID=329857 RepID=UPI0009BB5FA5|nr:MULTISPECIES: Na/Pi symporter [Cohnella]MBN2983296.1 Na/Pi cotransporter family protein [Cohnella algarum]